MKFSILTAALMTLASHAWAMPIAKPNVDFADRECGDIRPETIGKLPIEMINHPLNAETPIPIDQRDNAKYPHEKSAIDQIKEATGQLTCTKEGMVEPQIFNGSMVAVSGVIVTNAHNFAREGQLANYDKCIFSNGTQTVELDVHDLDIGTTDPDNFPGMDFAYIRMKSPLRGVNPIPVLDESRARVEPNTKIYGVVGLKRMFRPIEIRRLSKKVANTYHYFGSSKVGDSAGLHYAIDENKNVVALGMFQSGSSEPDNRPFNMTKKNGKLNYNIGLAFEGEVRNRLVQFSRGQRVVVAEAKLSQPPSVSDSQKL